MSELYNMGIIPSKAVKIVRKIASKLPVKSEVNKNTFSDT